MEEFINMLLQIASFRGIFTCHIIGLFQLSLHYRSVLIDFELIPSLLKEVGPVIVTTISVTESDILDIVAHHLLGAR